MMSRSARWATVAAVLVVGMGGLRGVPAWGAADDETMKSEKVDSAAGGGEEMQTSATRPAAVGRRQAGRFAATQPGGGLGGGMMFQRLRERADELGLTADQKEQIRKIAEDAREKARGVIQDANGDRQKVRQQVGEIMQEMFRQVREVLTPEQQQKWREMIERDGEPGPRRLGGLPMREEGKETREKAKVVAATKPAVKHEAIDPAKLELKRLDGKALALSSLNGKPLVLVFGSYSCPTFRENAKAIDELQRKYANKANLLLVYTKEAHPVGGWEVQRNKDAEITVQPHKDEAGRLAAAKQARTTLGLSMPMVVDSMEDDAVTAFDAFPNGCVVLGKDGKIEARQKWAEARGIREMLDSLAGVKPATRTAGIE